MKKTVIKYGSIAALITTTMMVISTTFHNENADTTTSEIIGFTGMFVAFIFIFLGIKSYRDKEQNGKIGFGTAFKVGFLICLVASTTYVVTWMIQTHYFFPDFMEKYALNVMEQAKKSGMNATELAAKRKELDSYIEWYKDPILKVLMTYMEIFPFGLIVTLISSFILKRK